MRRSWKPSHRAKYAVALCYFDGQVKHGLPLELGDSIQILEEFDNTWYRGFSTKNKSKKGVFPANYVVLKECNVDVAGPDETVTPIEDPVIKEVSYVLREWSIIWKKQFVNGVKKKLQSQIYHVMLQLMDMRKELILGALTQDQAKDVKQTITGKIDWGNSVLGLDLVPRYELNYEQVDVDKISTVELYNLHNYSSNHTADMPRGSIRRQTSFIPSTQPTIGQTHHLFLNLKMIRASSTDKLYIYVSLYDHSEAKFFTERYLIIQGESRQNEAQQSHSTLFTDLGNTDLIREAYIVVAVYRIGTLIESKKAPRHIYRRPMACAVHNVSDILRGRFGDRLENEIQMKLFCPSTDNDFPILHEYIIKKSSTKYSSSAQNQMIISATARMYHGDLEKVKKKDPINLRSITTTRKLGFSDVIMPGDIRNDLYLTFVKGEFDKGTKSAPKNVECQALVVGSDGTPIQSCVYTGSGENALNEYFTLVYYHNNVPKWNETVNFALPIEQFRLSHIRFELRHCSTRDKGEKKMFAFAFLKLGEQDQTALSDGVHELYVYKCDDPKKLIPVSSYLGLASSQAHEKVTHQPGGHFKCNEKESLVVETLLCSTKLTQNADLLGLLQWKSQPDKLGDHIKKLLKLNGEDIVKYLQDILDALFDMFTSERAADSSKHIFTALVSIFQKLNDVRFIHFKPIFDTYVSNMFSAPLVYRPLIECLQDRLSKVPTQSKAPPHNPFAVLEYIFKFIVQSRCLCVRANPGQGVEEFEEMIKDTFSAIGGVLSTKTEPVNQNLQVQLIASLPKISDQLVKVLNPVQVAKIICLMLTSLPPETAPEVSRARLEAMNCLVDSKLFSRQDSRRCLLGEMVSLIRLRMNTRTELKSCTLILANILQFINKEMIKGENLEKDLNVVVTALLDSVISVFLHIDVTSDAAGTLVACFIGMLRQMNEAHYKAVMEHQSKQLRAFINNMLLAFSQLVKPDFFRRDWMVLRLVTNSTIHTALQFLSQLLCFHYLNAPDFDQQLWSTYFKLTVTFLTQPCLQLENFHEAKRDKIFEKYGDLRVLMGHEILSMWQALGEHQIHFIPGMVGPFLKITLVPQRELRTSTLPIFADMILCELKYRKSFKTIETELVEKLDHLVIGGGGDDEYVNLFETIISDRLKEDEHFDENGTALIRSITRLLERLLDYRNVLNKDDDKDKQMTCLVNLLNFYRDEIDKQDMYIRYVCKLKELHLSSENYPEAAFTLLLHSELLEWSNKSLPESFGFPSQPEWKRKEQLYLEVIELFDKGECWEKGISLCKELGKIYERRYNYEKLCKILMKQAEFYENIINIKKLRPEHSYFRVGFFGQDFPLFLKNKVFIYRGKQLEQLISFQTSLQNEFPGATILGMNATVSGNMQQEKTRCIQICAVVPVPDLAHLNDQTSIPDPVLNYYNNNEVNVFQFDRAYHHPVKDKTNEFRSLHIERTRYTTSSKLPGILRWFEVIDSESTHLSPLETACDQMAVMNRNLTSLIASYTNPKQEANLQPLLMRLDGVINAPVSGGFANYEQAFFTRDYIQSHPENDDFVRKLRGLFVDQLYILEKGLRLQGKLPQEMKPLHRGMLEKLNIMKQSIKDVKVSPESRLRTLRNTETSDSRRSSSLSCQSFRSISPSSNQTSSSGRSSEMDIGALDFGPNFYNSPEANQYEEKSRSKRQTMKNAPSTVSLDSALGQTGKHKRSRTNSPHSRSNIRHTMAAESMTVSRMTSRFKEFDDAGGFDLLENPSSERANERRDSTSSNMSPLAAPRIRKNLSSTSQIHKLLETDSAPPIPPKRNPSVSGRSTPLGLSPSSTMILSSESEATTPTGSISTLTESELDLSNPGESTHNHALSQKRNNMTTSSLSAAPSPLTPPPIPRRKMSSTSFGNHLN